MEYVILKDLYKHITYHCLRKIYITLTGKPKFQQNNYTVPVTYNSYFNIWTFGYFLPNFLLDNISYFIPKNLPTESTFYRPLF